MTKLEKLERFRRYLQSSVDSRSNVIAKFLRVHKSRGIPKSITNRDIAGFVGEQTLEKKLLAYVVEEQRKIYDYEKHLDAYWKSYEQKEG